MHDTSDVNRLSRRRFLAGIAAGSAALCCPAWALADRKTVTVLTNHNDDTFSLFEEAFEKAQPQYRLKIVWMMPPDAMQFLRRDNGAGADVWWQAAPHNHLADIAKDGLLQPLAVETMGLPASIGPQTLAATDDLYRASQMTAFNFEVNTKAIADRHLPWPSDWPVLARAAYAGKIGLADPGKVRFGGLLPDVVLQSFGWEAGWALLSAIAGNAVLLPHGITDEVQSGRLAIGLHIDIVPNAEQRLRMPVERVYPAHGGIINIGFIGILKQAADADGARAFVNFVLSDAGQRLLPRTDLPRLPVRPSVYAHLAQNQFNPFTAQQQGQLTYHGNATGPNSNVLAAVFGAMLSDHANFKRLWARLHAAEKNPNHLTQPLGEVRKLLQQVPLTADQAASDELKQAYRNDRNRGPNGEPIPPAPADRGGEPAKPVKSEAALRYEAAWTEAFRQNQKQAAKLLDEVGA
jgi:phosphoglycerate transport regulatory protein PgtC